MTQQALINPNTNAIVFIGAMSFPATPPLIWISAPDGVTQGGYTYNGTSFVAIPPPPAPTKWYVLKSTIRTRLTAVNLSAQADAARASLSQAQQNAWNEAVVVNNDDPNMIAFLTAIGANPTAILALDPAATAFFGKRE